MSEIITVQDLETLKKHEIFEAEVITGKAGGLATGVNIDNATNAVTGQMQDTLPKILRDLGMQVQPWPASVGGVLTSPSQIFLNDIAGSAGKDDYYAWAGSFPKTVTPGTDPALPGSGYVKRSDKFAKASAREALRRSCAEAGYDLVGGSFEAGGVVNTASQAFLHESSGKAYYWTGAFPKIVPPGSAPTEPGWAEVNAVYRIGSVSDMIATTLSAGSVVHTDRNQFGLLVSSSWDISATQNTETYSLTMPGSLFANLRPRQVMYFAEFGFGSPDPAINSAAVTEACRVARANAVMCQLDLPAGGFNCNQIEFDVDRRGFSFGGPGWDICYITSKVSGTSLHLVGLDPRNPALNGQHFYQRVYGFTIDGDITGRGASAANRTVCTAHYAYLAYKSVGHRLSNVDIHSLSTEFNGHTQARTNGATKTLNSIRAKYNALKIGGYIGGEASGVSTAVFGYTTTLASPVSAGATTATLTNASGFTVYDIVEIESEAKPIVAIAGNVVTFETALSSAHAAGVSVKNPVFGVDLDAIFEVGQIQIGDSTAVSLNGQYMEECKVYVFGYQNGLTISSNTIGEANPTIQIDQVDRRSVINIDTNATAFPVTLSVKDRDGNVNPILDLYNMPLIKIDKCSRAQSSILINGAHSFTSINVTRTYDTLLGDSAFTRMDFTGLFHSVIAGATTEVINFKLAPTLTGLGGDGVAYDIEAVCRREANAVVGILKRIGNGSTSATTPAADTVRVASSYAFFNQTNGVDVSFGASTTRSNIVVKGEPAGGSVTHLSISGVVTGIY